MSPHMDKFFRCGFASLLLVAMLSAAGSAVAANDKKDGKDQARRLQQKVSELEQEKSQLLQAKSQMEGQLKDAAEQLKRIKRSADAANRKGLSLDKGLKTAESEKAELAEKLATAEQKLADMEKTLADTSTTLAGTAGALRQTQEERGQLETSLTLRTQEFLACTAKNDSLYRLGGELMRQLGQKSWQGSVLQNEPLTQLQRVAIENTVEEYREKFDQELLDQQQAARSKLARQQREDEFAAMHKAEQEKTDRELVERGKAEHLKAKQQNSLDHLTRKIKEFFEGVEW